MEATTALLDIAKRLTAVTVNRGESKAQTLKLCCAQIMQETTPQVYGRTRQLQSAISTFCNKRMSLTRGSAQEGTQGLLLAQAVPGLRKRLHTGNQQSFVPQCNNLQWHNLHSPYQCTVRATKNTGGCNPFALQIHTCTTRECAH